MLLALQTPLADSRRFLEGAPRLARPVWPLADPDIEFVRFFGSIRQRRHGGLLDWQSENEGVVCAAARPLVFRASPSFRDATSDATLVLRRALQHFYFDGLAVGKFALGVAPKSRAPATGLADDAQTKRLFAHYLGLPVAVRNPYGEPAECALLQAGKPLAQLYAIASSIQNRRQPTTPPEWHVLPGAPLLYFEFRRPEAYAIPGNARPIALPPTLDLRLSLYTLTHQGRSIKVWILDVGEGADPVTARDLRLYLLRLHAEHECLRLVLRNLQQEYLAPPRGSQASELLQCYFNEATRRIKRIEARSERFTPEIGAIARAATELLNPGNVDTLLTKVRQLEPRGNIMRKLSDYVSAGASQVQIVEGDQINFSGTATGSILNFKTTVSGGTQQIDLPARPDEQANQG